MSGVAVVELEKKTSTLAQEARALKVMDQASYDTAAECLLGVAALRREIVEHHSPVKKAAHEAWQAAIAAERRLLDPVTEAEGIYKRAIGAYEAQQRRIEAEERAKAAAEAQRAAEEAREHEIEQAECEGADIEEVAAIARAPLPLVAPAPVQPVFQQARGVTTAVIWKGEVTSLASLVQAIAAGQADLHLVKANDVVINEKARATRGTLPIKGVRFFSEPVVRAGRR